MIQSVGVLGLLMFFGSWHQNTGNAHVAQWEDSTVSANTHSAESIKDHFYRFLTEGKDNDLSLATLEWLDLPFSETPYKSWYLGPANGYHLFNLQAEADPFLNLLVFDDQGRIRDRHQFNWGDGGGGMDFINGQVLQLILYNEDNAQTGIDRINLLIDLNGQFKTLDPVPEVHPKRLFPEVSNKILSREELETKSKEELQEMADEVLAANGEVFSDPTLQSYFEHMEWYRPGPVDDVTELHPIEAYNMANIQILISSLSI